MANPTVINLNLVMSAAPNYETTPIMQDNINGTNLVIALLNADGSPYTPDGSVTFKAVKSDWGTVLQDSTTGVSVLGNVVTVTLHEQVHAKTGLVCYQILVTGGIAVYSQVRYLRVYQGAEEGAILSSNEFTSLANLLVSLEDAETIALAAKELADSTIEEESLRQANEQTRQTNETARVAAENLRGLEVANARGGKATLNDRLTESEGKVTANKEEIDKHALKITTLEQSLLPFQYDSVKQEYINIDKFFEPLKNGKVYTTEFYQYDVSPSSAGTKKDDNADLICEPSTNTVKGRNDYENIGLFMSIDVNAYVDENGDYHVTAIKGDGRFQKDGTNGDVYVMAMPGYIKRYEDENVWSISYSDTMYPGFEILDEAVKPDGTIRPYLLHAKYVAGRNPHENNKLASISGIPAEYNNMSHNGQITEFKAKGTQYSGKTSHDDFYVQLMFWLKYATTISDNIMKGCQSYNYQYVNKVAETGVNRVIITNAEASNLLVGSTVSVGDYGAGSISTDRSSAQNYNLAERVNITDIVDLGDGNSAVYVDSGNFNTTLSTTISTYPWNTGACDNVLGKDGSPSSNTSGKEPFVINGIEMMVGGYEVVQNLIIYNNNTNPDDYRIQVYACYDCTKYSTAQNANYDLIGYSLAKTNNAWKYISKISIDPNHPTVLIPTETEASSTTGYGDGVYTSAPTTSSRVWLSLGALSHGTSTGLRCLHAASALSNAYWAILGRLSATGQSRRRAGVN